MKTKSNFHRTSLLLSAAIGIFVSCARAEATYPAFTPDPALAAEQAHAEIWRRFIDQHGVMVDFTDLDGSINLPTPEECRQGKPNALGWFQPIENGAMFTGNYMDAAILRWQHSKHLEDADRARRLMEGLLLLASISEVKGFIGRGVSTDGKAHFAMGSDDQTAPWFWGLWRYLDSGLATNPERERIVGKLIETADAIVALGWRMPAEPPFGTRGSFAHFNFESVARQLFVMKMMHVVTGQAMWDAMYREALRQHGGDENISKQEICRRGMVFWYARTPKQTHNWTSASGVAALRGLWELEEDAALKEAYAEGLRASATLAAKTLSQAEQFDPNDPSAFSQDWRSAMLPHWKPQQTAKEAQDMAGIQSREFARMSPRRLKENSVIRESSAAAWIVTLCPDPAVVTPLADAIERVIRQFDYRRLYYCTFYGVEAAWWRLKSAGK